MAFAMRWAYHSGEREARRKLRMERAGLFRPGKRALRFGRPKDAHSAFIAEAGDRDLASAGGGAQVKETQRT